MPIYNFQQRFAEAVRSGAKRQTIRARGKRARPEVGQIAHLYTGLRTKGCELLGRWPIVEVSRIIIYPRVDVVHLVSQSERLYSLSERSRKLLEIARADGFLNTREFFNWFEEHHGAECSGYLVKWEPGHG